MTPPSLEMRNWLSMRYVAAMDLMHLNTPGTEIAVRVTPRASRNTIILEDGMIRVYVTVVPESGKANAAVVKLLARALGVAKSRLRLKRGAASRDKVFEVV